MSSGYKHRRPSRESHDRDAKLIIIAAEGTKTEKTYFEGLASPAWYRNSRIQVEILTKEGTAKSPEHVLDELDRFKRQYRLKADDELWLVIDVDDWGQAKLSKIARLCQQKRYRLAVSNPCFELWLLLHLKSLDEYTEDEQEELLKNQKVNKTRRRLDYELFNLLGSYNKAKPDTSQFLPHVKIAIIRAQALDINQDDRWPQSLGTHVYLLAKKIIPE